jgi:hypothetical protein
MLAKLLAVLCMKMLALFALATLGSMTHIGLFLSMSKASKKGNIS